MLASAESLSGSAAGFCIPWEVGGTSLIEAERGTSSDEHPTTSDCRGGVVTCVWIGVGGSSRRRT